MPSDTPSELNEVLASVRKLTRDLRAGATTLNEAEARFLVDAYYMMQDDRIRAGHQLTTLGKNSEPHELFVWLATQREILEGQVKGALGAYSKSKPAGRWAQSIVGIGPVISAGLLAHIDPEKAATAGAVWRYAGLDPTVRWEKGKKRPWNASLKRLSFLIGESFVKVSGNERDTYGKVYKDRKEYEIARNDAGLLADQAAAMLERKKFGADTKAREFYEAGKLPPAHIHRRATRYAAKLFLSHYHHVAYESHFGEPPPKPYIIEHGGHVHFTAPPNWPME